ncbi:RNA polymerase sigma-70 factor [Leptobacterium flavescens]|uniref:RNA polymerase sigma-70 factor n=1 Tax=Leptobacterium flavescens TaxID=472055 RepID=A0A6P0UKX9_9FLAO|nr:RNA polymerase sigma-70 factor [Leptobacterium flavescens]NER13874.1 RNA polymerase sigma-70 factor [Leptobacterium flavescens]
MIRVDINNAIFISLINDGDSKAFETLYKLYYNRLLHLAKSYVGNSEDAEEIVQDALLKVWKKKKKITTNINGYLYKITRNSCLDHLRKNKTRIGLYDNFDQKDTWINYISLKDNAASLLIEQELEKQITEAIELLPEKCRRVFIKSRIEGLKQKDISEDLNISINTVENHIAKALKHMRLHLREFLSLF